MNRRNSYWNPDLTASMAGDATYGNGKWLRTRQHAGGQETTPGGLRILVVGTLVLDIVLALKSRLEELGAAISTGTEKIRADWGVRARVGGFAAWASRVAYRTGARTWLSSVISLPTPTLFEEFFEQVNADTTLLTAFPGPAPASVQLLGPDGHLLLTRSGGVGHIPPSIPDDLADRFDAVVVNPGPQVARKQIFDRLLRTKPQSDGGPTIAVCGRSDWSAAELGRIRDTGWFLFFNEGEALEVARRIGCAHALGVNETARLLKARVGASRLVITLGHRGALILNGHKEPLHIAAVPVHECDTTGAGDLLVAHTAIKRAKGFSDEESLAAAVSAVSQDISSQ